MHAGRRRRLAVSIAYSQQTANDYLAWLTGDAGKGGVNGTILNNSHVGYSPKIKGVYTKQVGDRWLFLYHDSAEVDRAIESLPANGYSLDKQRLEAMRSTTTHMGIRYEPAKGGIYDGYDLVNYKESLTKPEKQLINEYYPGSYPAGAVESTLKAGAITRCSWRARSESYGTNSRPSSKSFTKHLVRDRKR